MYRGKSICVVVPAYNEELLIAQTVSTMPDFVDHVVVVDDASNDDTVKIAEELVKSSDGVTLVKHADNRGVGAAISSGYVWCRDNDYDVAVVMAGDGQMDPDDLPALLEPIVEDEADYTKGNRLVSGEAWKRIPHTRYLGNSVLSLLTKIASGYWHVTDSQTGYTALNKKALHLLPIEDIYPRYGMPNDFLVTLNIFSMRVRDVVVNPVYDIGEKSGIKILRIIPVMLFMLSRWFFRRMIQKYVIRDFHPLVFFYGFSSVLFAADFAMIGRLLFLWHKDGVVPQMTALTVVFLTIMGFQALLFAMMFDMEHNKHLKCCQQ